MRTCNRDCFVYLFSYFFRLSTRSRCYFPALFLAVRVSFFLLGKAKTTHATFLPPGKRALAHTAHLGGILFVSFALFCWQTKGFFFGTDTFERIYFVGQIVWCFRECLFETKKQASHTKQCILHVS